MPADDGDVWTHGFSYRPAGPRVVFAPGRAREQLAGEFDRLGLTRVVLVATRREYARCSQLIAGLHGRIAAVVDGVRRHVPLASAQAAIRTAQTHHADGILCIGGGSSTGTAKAIAGATRLPIVAVPTTYAGSELTPIYGTTAAGRKSTLSDEGVIPQVVVYDATLSADLPLNLTVFSAVNALAHCVGGLFSAAHNPVADMWAQTGIRALADGLRAVTATPAGVSARSQLLLGAYLAGSVLAQLGSSVHHQICHVLGGAYDLPHAQTHAAMLPHVLRQLAPNRPVGARMITAALGTESGDPSSAVMDLLGQVGARVTLTELGVPRRDLDRLVEQLGQRLAPASGLDQSALRSVLREGFHPPMPSEARGAPGLQ